jgi:hypothetical protein
MSQATDKKHEGRFNDNPTLPFNPTNNNEVLKATHVYTLLDITWIDVNVRSSTWSRKH